MGVVCAIRKKKVSYFFGLMTFCIIFHIFLDVEKKSTKIQRKCNRKLNVFLLRRLCLWFYDGYINIIFFNSEKKNTKKIQHRKIECYIIAEALFVVL